MNFKNELQELQPIINYPSQLNLTTLFPVPQSQKSIPSLPNTSQDNLDS